MALLSKRGPSGVSRTGTFQTRKLKLDLNYLYPFSEDDFYAYLPNGIHLEKLRSLVGDTHLKVFGQVNIDATVFSHDECLKCILVSTTSVQHLYKYR
jgi:hypothetical protein